MQLRMSQGRRSPPPFTYNFCMKLIRRSNGKQVAQFTTPSGVMGTVATSIPADAFAGWAQSLENRLNDLDKIEARRRSGSKKPAGSKKK